MALHDKKKNEISALRKPGKVLEIPDQTLMNVFLTEGLTAKQIAKRYAISPEYVENLVSDQNLEEVRKNLVRKGLEEIQSVQLTQANKLLELESQLKAMRIIQLEKTLDNFMAYYVKHGHFFKLHPVTEEILLDTAGMPMQLNIPSVTRELSQLKEGVTFSEGLKQILGKIDKILNKKPKSLEEKDAQAIDITEYDNLFEPKKED